MKMTRLAGLLAVALAAVGAPVAYGAGVFPGFPTTTGPTGNETIPADTNAAGGAPPQTVLMPSGLLSSYGTNVLVGPDFGQALWQRGTTPISAAQLGQAVYGPDGWYASTVSGALAQTITVSKQTGATDIPNTITNTTASARIQRVASQTGTQSMQFGQLVPNDTSVRFPGNTAIFSCYLFVGANFSPTSNQVQMVIAYHSAADATTEAANAQGTNTATFASSVTGTQNITNYTEAVNTAVFPTTTWARYSVAAAIPNFIGTTTTAVTGVGVKLTWVPTGTAGTNDFIEVANCQLESRAGTSTTPSIFNRRTLAEEYAVEFARFWEIQENGSGTSIYATGYLATTGGANIAFALPAQMRITPVVSPITVGGFKLLNANTQTTISSITTTGLTQNPRTASVNANTAGGLTAGQGVMFIGSGAGTGVLGFSAEP